MPDNIDQVSREQAKRLHHLRKIDQRALRMAAQGTLQQAIQAIMLVGASLELVAGSGSNVEISCAMSSCSLRESVNPPKFCSDDAVMKRRDVRPRVSVSAPTLSPTSHLKPVLPFHHKNTTKNNSQQGGGQILDDEETGLVEQLLRRSDGARGSSDEEEDDGDEEAAGVGRTLSSSGGRARFRGVGQGDRASGDDEAGFPR